MTLCTVFLFGSAGILLGGVAVDFVHNQSVFLLKKRRKKRKKKRRRKRKRSSAGHEGTTRHRVHVDHHDVAVHDTIPGGHSAKMDPSSVAHENNKL